VRWKVIGHFLGALITRPWGEGGVESTCPVEGNLALSGCTTHPWERGVENTTPVEGNLTVSGCTEPHLEGGVEGGGLALSDASRNPTF